MVSDGNRLSSRGRTTPGALQQGGYPTPCDWLPNPISHTFPNHELYLQSSSDPLNRQIRSSRCNNPLPNKDCPAYLFYFSLQFHGSALTIKYPHLNPSIFEDAFRQL